VPLLPRSHLSVAGAPFPYILGVPSHLLPSLGRAAPSAGASGELWLMLDEGRVEGVPMQQLPWREDSLLRARLRAPPEAAGVGGAGTALQRACLATLASLLRDTPSLAEQLRGGPAAVLPPSALDAAAAQLAERFVQCQPTSARAFARLLCETSAFRIYLEALLRPRHRWPRWLLEFSNAADEARG
jgi:hypothetical protein